MDPTVSPRASRLRLSRAEEAIYAIGDIHGCQPLLVQMLRAILDTETRMGAAPTLVFLGDYVDRGPASRLVLAALCRLRASPSVRTRFIRGNHEQAMLDFLEHPETGPAWCGIGGAPTLASYGVRPPAPGAGAQSWASARDSLKQALPERHLQLLCGLEPFVAIGDYFFTHAGARPGVGLEDQDPLDLMTIRKPFLTDDKAFDKVVVHGHSVCMMPHIDHRRIGVDTAAYATGTLTAIRIVGDRKDFLSVGRGGTTLRPAAVEPQMAPVFR